MAEKLQTQNEHPPNQEILVALVDLDDIPRAWTVGTWETLEEAREGTSKRLDAYLKEKKEQGKPAPCAREDFRWLVTFIGEDKDNA